MCVCGGGGGGGGGDLKCEELYTGMGFIVGFLLLLFGLATDSTHILQDYFIGTGVTPLVPIKQPWKI